MSSRPRDSVGIARLELVQGSQDGGQVSLVAGYIDQDKTGFESIADSAGAKPPTSTCTAEAPIPSCQTRY